MLRPASPSCSKELLHFLRLQLRPSCPSSPSFPCFERSKLPHRRSSTLHISEVDPIRRSSLLVHRPRAVPRRIPRDRRDFTRNISPLRFGGRFVSRPQLPFLHPPSTSSSARYRYAVAQRLTLTNIKRHLLSTETKARWNKSVRWHIKFQFYLWPTLFMLYLFSNGLKQTWLEHEYPTPREWTFWSRWGLRSGKHLEFDDDAKVERVLVDWGRAGMFYARLLARLEDPKKDGANVLRRGDDGGDILVEGVGRTGWDVSMKGEQWRRGYWEALMGAARVAERLEGMVARKDRGDKTSLKEVLPKECLVGPSNPRPRPMPRGMGEAWREEDAEDAYDPPEKLYLTILTTKGFSSGQKIEAALAYADWCGFKGLPDTAQGVLEWGMDIAVAGAEANGIKDVVNPRTGVIDSNKTTLATANQLKVSTAMGVHFAQAGEVRKALPIFLSVLKSRRELPAEPTYARFESDEKRKTKDAGAWTILYLFKDWLIESPFPAPPPSGDERPFHNLSEACEEVGLMTYVGEILYATSSEEKGLSWTRDAVDASEAVMWVMKEEGREEGKDKCKQCLTIGLENWKKMATSLAVAAERRERDLLIKEKEGKGNSWFGESLEKQKEKAKQEAKKWQEEEAQIELRRQKTMPLTMSLRPVKKGWFSI